MKQLLITILMLTLSVIPCSAMGPGILGNLISNQTTQEILFTSSNGTNSAWTQTSCTNDWECVEYDGGGTLNATALNQIFTVNMDDTTLTTIDSVTLRFYIDMFDTSTTEVAPVLWINSTAYLGTSVGVPITYTLLEYTWTQNPDTSSAWTASAVNALEAGLKYSVSGAWFPYCEYIDLVVEGR